MKVLSVQVFRFKLTPIFEKLEKIFKKRYTFCKFADIIKGNWSPLVMSDFRDLLQEADICELNCTDKYEALHELITLADRLISLPNPNEFEYQIKIREQKQSTGIGKGIAIAHATTKQVQKIRVALGISKTGIDFESIDGKPVHLLFLVANPPDTQVEYLSVLSALVRLLRRAQFRQSIICCSTPNEIKTLLDNSLAFEMSA